MMMIAAIRISGDGSIQSPCTEKTGLLSGMTDSNI
jgi:hypothetical protein